MRLKGKNVLITGADGFIGSHLVEEILAEGGNVRALAFYNSFSTHGWLDSLPASLRREIEICPGDIRDAAFVSRLVKGQQVVFHLAALIGIPYSYQAPDAYVATNVAGTLNVLESCRQHGVERLVHTSTSEVYGSAQFVPITEEHALCAQSPYAATKIGADQLALSYHRSFGLPVAVVRPFNTFGPRQSARAVIPSIIIQLAKGIRTVNLGSLSPTRDFTYVKDTVRGFVSAAKAEAAVGEVVNLGSNFEVSIGDTLEMIASIMGVRIRSKLDRQRVRPGKSEVTRLWADNSKARKLLRWQPRCAGRAGFRSALEKTIMWFSNPANLERYKALQYNV